MRTENKIAGTASGNREYFTAVQFLDVALSRYGRLGGIVLIVSIWQVCLDMAGLSRFGRFGGVGGIGGREEFWSGYKGFCQLLSAKFVLSAFLYTKYVFSAETRSSKGQFTFNM